MLLFPVSLSPVLSAPLSMLRACPASYYQSLIVFSAKHPAKHVHTSDISLIQMPNKKSVRTLNPDWSSSHGHMLREGRGGQQIVVAHHLHSVHPVSGLQRPMIDSSAAWTLCDSSASLSDLTWLLLPTTSPSAMRLDERLVSLADFSLSHLRHKEQQYRRDQKQTTMWPKSSMKSMEGHYCWPSFGCRWSSKNKSKL